MRLAKSAGACSSSLEKRFSTLHRAEGLSFLAEPAALDYYVDEFTRTGFTGALNYYRCRDRNWEIAWFLDGAVVRQPSLFIGGAADPALEQIVGVYDHSKPTCLDCGKRYCYPV